MKKAYLVLSNGMAFEGQRIGADGDAVGELVFTTGMCGYLETLTDPSYAGQIVLQTFPLIGNYGVIESDFEGECAVKGYVVRECCAAPSNFRCEYDLDTFLKKHGVPGICGVDTRQLTRIIREQGVMNATICDAVPDDLSAVCAYTVAGVVPQVSCKEQAVYPAQGGKKFAVTLVDYGAKRNIIRSLTARGCEVTVVPQDMSAETILAMHPDGVMLSNGPGDPAENTYCIEQIRKLVGRVPVFGICLGHQLTALAMGGRTVKLKYGHRGVNQPVREVGGTRTYITSQNHGYAVVGETVDPALARVRYINLNDGTVEGVEHVGKPVFTVQYHPEVCPGPMDTSYLFDKFLENIDKTKGGAQ